MPPDGDFQFAPGEQAVRMRQHHGQQAKRFRRQGEQFAVQVQGLGRGIVSQRPQGDRATDAVQRRRAASMQGEQTGLEGCLSVPGKYGIVTRPMVVRVRAQDRYGTEFEVEDEELTARCFCHEIEHLDGHLYTEHCKVLTDEELEQYIREQEKELDEE